MPRRVHIHGFPFEVLSAKDIADEAAKGGVHPYILMRVADADTSVYTPELRARMRRAPCETCKQICWYDPNCADDLAPLTMEWICVPCMTVRARLRNALGGS